MILAIYKMFLRKYIKKTKLVYSIYNLFGHNSITKNQSFVLTIGKSILIKYCSITMIGNNYTVQIGDGCNLTRNADSGYLGAVYIGASVNVNVSKDRPSIFNAVDNSKIVIGNNYLF